MARKRITSRDQTAPYIVGVGIFGESLTRYPFDTLAEAQTFFTARITEDEDRNTFILGPARQCLIHTPVCSTRQAA